MASAANTMASPPTPNIRTVDLCGDTPALVIQLVKPGQAFANNESIRFIVSPTIMLQHCGIFQSLNTQAQIPCNDLVGHEVFLRVLHDRMDEESWDRGIWTIGVEGVKGAIQACADWGAEPKKLRYFVAFWLGTKDFCSFSPGQLNDIMSIFDTLGGFDIMKQCLGIKMGQLSPGNLPPIIYQYPPVLAPTGKQRGTLVFDGELDKWDYRTFGFSPRFKAVYGEPTSFYSDFFRLMTTPFDESMIPKYNKFSFERFADGQNFFRFMKSVQNTAQQNGHRVISRPEVEAGYAKCLVNMFEQRFVPSNAGNTLPVSTEILGKAQRALRESITKRLHPRQELQKYWEKVKGKSNLDILAREDGCDERAEDMELPDEWKDSGNDDTMEGVEGDEMETLGREVEKTTLNKFHIEDSLACLGEARKQGYRP